MQPTFPLPFDMPSDAELNRLGRKVFYHYIVSFGRQINNLAPLEDYYATQYMPPNGEGGKHAAYGGWQRDRPMFVPRAPTPDPDFRFAGALWETKVAKMTGADGWLLDILTGPDTSDVKLWEIPLALIKAAAEEGFTIALSPDGSAMRARSSTYMADVLAKLISLAPGVMDRTSDGRIIISPFAPEFMTGAYWADVKTRLATLGFSVVFWPYYVNQWDEPSTFGQMNPIAIGHGRWGDSSAGSTDDASVNNRRAADRLAELDPTKAWMGWARFQDARPRSATYWEAAATGLWRGSIESALKNEAPRLQINTWNDWAESSAVAPSEGSQWAQMAVITHGIVEYKTGVKPEIKRDMVIITNRKHHSSVTTFPQQTRVAPAPPDVLDIVETTVFLKDAAHTVTTTVGAETVSQTGVPAGVTIQTLPFYSTTVGRPSATVIRSGVPVIKGTVVSASAITRTPAVQDMTYRSTASGEM